MLSKCEENANTFKPFFMLSDCTKLRKSPKWMILYAAFRAFAKNLRVDTHEILKTGRTWLLNPFFFLPGTNKHFSSQKACRLWAYFLAMTVLLPRMVCLTFISVNGFLDIPVHDFYTHALYHILMCKSAHYLPN